MPYPLRHRAEVRQRIVVSARRLFNRQGFDATSVAQIVNAYLSRQHFEDVENSCPMVALPTDIARNGQRAKRAFETVLCAMVSVLKRSVTRHRASSEVRARAIAALCIGGMVVARALEDRAQADEMRRACVQVALQLGGWQAQRPKSRTRRS